MVSCGTFLWKSSCSSRLRSAGSSVRLIIEPATEARSLVGALLSTLPLWIRRRKNADSSLEDRLMPSNTTGPVKVPETTISYATDAPLLYPTTTSALTRFASSDVTRAQFSMLASSRGGAPALPGRVAATNRTPSRTASPMTSAYEPALHMPPGSSRTVHSASRGPVSRSSQSTSPMDAYCPLGELVGERRSAILARASTVTVTLGHLRQNQRTADD